MNAANAQNPGPFTNNPNKVFAAEKEYINTRRRNNNLEELSDIEDTWGICFSGGGIRSATICLGIMQKFMKENIFKFFDYLSTVSGGGYIGSCLTSLLSNPEECYLKTGETGKKPGVEPETSPFVGLNKFDDYENEAATKLGVRHQIHHLRTHGEYLIPHKDIFSRDFQRALGTLFAGILHHLILFTLFLAATTALVHFVLFSITAYPADTQQKIADLQELKKPVPPITAAPFLAEFNYEDDTYYKITEKTLGFLKGEKVSASAIERLSTLQDKLFYKGRDNFLQALIDHLSPLPDKTDLEKIDLRKALNDLTEEPRMSDLILQYAGNPSDSQLAYVQNEIKTWLFSRLGVPLYRMFYEGFESRKLHYLISFVIGIVFCFFAFQRADGVKEAIYKEGNQAFESAKSGFNLEDHYESTFIRGVNLTSWGVMTAGLFSYGVWNSSRPESQGNYLSALFLPLGFALGASVWSLIQSNFLRPSSSKRIKEDRVRRSLYNAVQGSSFYSIVFSLLIPFSLVLLFSINYFKPKFWWSLIALALSYFVFKRSGQGNKITQLVLKFRKFLLSLFLLLFVALAYNAVSDFLIRHVYSHWTIVWLATNWVPLVICIIVTLVIIVLGYLINSNRISPHYFYRDRLTEAYLKTDARIKREKNHEKTRQGMPLVSVRNHEDLKLSQLGENNNCGPYHIIVTALNLQGSDELNRKTMLSEHFIFSKYYVGSKITGYVKTAEYRCGETKLARAMTISAAAAGSAMGLYSFGAQAFASTLFNMRLGYWMANPWYYYKETQDADSNKSQKSDKNSESKKNPEPKYPFWPKWLLLEMLNKTTARDRMVNLSDGGHTGDNLGLLMLLKRRCKVIVICDGEADGDYKFESFNNAVRMAYIEENIEIDIDFSPIVPEKNKEGAYAMSDKSVAIGKITYPARNKNKRITTGTLIYLKSSLSDPGKPHHLLPVHVKNYHKGHPNFPHQSTADQFFDDAQFEAYRALGEHIAQQAIEEDPDSTLKNGYT
jgi:hypothetical protein